MRRCVGMKTKPTMTFFRWLSFAIFSAGFLFSSVGAAETAPSVKKILFFTKCSNFEHSVVKERAGQPGFAAQALKELGAKHGIEFTFSKDGSLFSPEYLAQFDAYFFYTSGDLL